MKTLTEENAAQLQQASENITDLVSAAVQGIEDDEIRDRVILEFNDGSAVIRQVTELRPSLMTVEYFVELSDGEVVQLGGNAF